MKYGFLKVAAATGNVKVANCDFNKSEIIRLTKDAYQNGAKVLVLPELSITAYTCGDLFLQQTLLKNSTTALKEILAETKKMEIILCIGLPVAVGGSIYNCGAVCYKGKVLGLVPKQHIPNYSEFYEARYFTKGEKVQFIDFLGESTPIGTNILFACKELQSFVLGVEICEDVWVTVPPSCNLAQAGATVIANLSASDEIIGKAEYRENLIAMQSAKTLSAYLYADAGLGESSTDMVYAGHNLICENGTILNQSQLFETGIIYADIDLERLLHERRRTTTFTQNQDDFHTVSFSMEVSKTRLSRKFVQTPFVPQDKNQLEKRCNEILTLQARGLATRMKHTGATKTVIGLSGGLDSALALVVTAKAYKILNLDPKGIITVTMPCFGTTERTRNNSIILADVYGTTLKEINIEKAVKQHFIDIEHDGQTLDVTFENSQARERTQILMDIANQAGGLVVGTGDLSELALGWATYNGDHMSMYAVNASIPKTLVRYLIGYEAQQNIEICKVLSDVLDTPVSPELLPPKDGEISQKTEELVGPYILHDFFLYYILRFGYSPKKIYHIAVQSFKGSYDKEVIKKWLIVFIRRFFTQQFKRSCMPDAPKIGSVTLSPRGDWRMPSDACYDIWLKEAEDIKI